MKSSGALFVSAVTAEVLGRACTIMYFYNDALCNILRSKILRQLACFAFVYKETTAL